MIELDKALALHTCATGGTANFKLNAGISCVKSRSSCCSAAAAWACAGLLYWATRASILDDSLSCFFCGFGIEVVEAITESWWLRRVCFVVGASSVWSLTFRQPRARVQVGAVTAITSGT